MAPPVPIIRCLQHAAYQVTWQAMKQFTDNRTSETPDEIWLIEHDPVFTLGQNGKPEHILNPGDIPVVQVDRGGQVTYHGPGQLMVYVLLDLRRLGLGIRDLVSALEQAVIAVLADYHIVGKTQCAAPGVYVDDAKICSIGLRIRRGCSYHGIAFNIAMDLAPFSGINPCGFKNLAMTQLSTLGGANDLETVSHALIGHLMPKLGYTTHILQNS